MQIGDVKSAKALWEAIKERYIGVDHVKEVQLQTLNAKFDRLKMLESKSIDSYVGKLSGITSKSEALGETIEESKLLKKFLKTLPRLEFIQIVSSLEQVLDLKTIWFEDVVSRLKAYEERIGEEEGNGDGQAKVLFTRSSDGDGGLVSGGGGLMG